jgi:hypothetical protein
MVKRRRHLFIADTDDSWLIDAIRKLPEGDQPPDRLDSHVTVSVAGASRDVPCTSRMEVDPPPRRPTHVSNVGRPKDETSHARLQPRSTQKRDVPRLSPTCVDPKTRRPMHVSNVGRPRNETSRARLPRSSVQKRCRDSPRWLAVDHIFPTPYPLPLPLPLPLPFPSPSLSPRSPHQR